MAEEHSVFKNRSILRSPLGVQTVTILACLEGFAHTQSFKKLSKAQVHTTTTQSVCVQNFALCRSQKAKLSPA